MSTSTNLVILLGGIGSDAKLFDGGVSFSLATSKKWNDKDTGANREETLWHRCVIYGKRAEALRPMLRKSSRVQVVGSLKPGIYTDKDNVRHKTSDVIVEEIVLLTPRPTDEQNPARDDDAQTGGAR